MNNYYILKTLFYHKSVMTYTHMHKCGVLFGSTTVIYYGLLPNTKCIEWEEKKSSFLENQMDKFSTTILLLCPKTYIKFINREIQNRLVFNQF